MVGHIVVSICSFCSFWHGGYTKNIPEVILSFAAFSYATKAAIEESM